LSDFAFIPNESQIQNSNIQKFMNKHNISSLEKLIQKANQNVEWFWKEVDKDIGIIWDKPYKKIIDVSRGIQWSK